jgi:GxxExxY protein
MNTNKRELLLKNEVFSIVGSAYEVLNTLGHGLLEKPYENALCVEFELRGIPLAQQPKFDVMYKGVKVGNYVPDLIVYNKIIVDIKSIEHIGNHEIGQIINYLKLTNLQVGLLLNFKYSKLNWRRVVLQEESLINSNKPSKISVYSRLLAVQQQGGNPMCNFNGECCNEI